MEPQTVEIFMSIVAILTNVHWFPQLARLINRKQSDDFSLWTTLILLLNNVLWFGYAGYIGSVSLSIQQGLSLIMLLFFGSVVIHYRTTNLLFSESFVNRWRSHNVRV
jgi:uncharacterized protein with PQ loop repeat